MVLNKTAVAFCSSCQHRFLPPHSGILSSTSSSTSVTPTRSARPKSSSRTSTSSLARHQHPPRRQQHGYATSATTEPHTWPTTSKPTPYQVLGIHKTAPYSKKRFYELVKIYHPDRNVSDMPDSSPARHISSTSRLERYRLIVAANDLLSDPEKRTLYDHHGVGWTAGRTATRHDQMRHADRSWRNEPNNAAHNATWEDWERWYETRDGTGHARPKPRYMSNSMFASLVVTMCMIGALAQRTRAESEGDRYVALKNGHDIVIGEQMRQRTVSSAGKSREERVDMFVRDRETANHDFVPGRADGPPSGRPFPPFT